MGESVCGQPGPDADLVGSHRNHVWDRGYSLTKVLHHQSPPPPHYRQSGFIQSGNRARDTLPYQEQSVMQVLPNSSWYLGSPVIYGEGHFTRVLVSSLHYFLLLSKFIFMDLPVHRTPIAHGICQIPLTTLQTAAHPCNKGHNGRSPK